MYVCWCVGLCVCVCVCFGVCVCVLVFVCVCVCVCVLVGVYACVCPRMLTGSFRARQHLRTLAPVVNEYLYWRLYRPNDNRGPSGPKAAWNSSYRCEKTPKKTCPDRGSNPGPLVSKWNFTSNYIFVILSWENVTSPSSDTMCHSCAPVVYTVASPNFRNSRGETRRRKPDLCAVIWSACIVVAVN